MQKLMAVGIPISVLVSGLFFPLGVLIYWFTSNAWTMGQQLYINRFHPHLPPPDAAAGTGGEDPINPNGDHPTTPDRTTEPRAPRPGQRLTRSPRNRAPAQRKAKRQEDQTNRRSSAAGGAPKTRPVNRSPRLTSHLGRARRILSSQRQQGPAQQSGSSVRSSQRTTSDQNDG